MSWDEPISGGFGDSAAPARQAEPPMWMLALAAVCVLAATALLMPPGLAPWLIGYPLACLIPFGLVASFRRAQVRSPGGSAISPRTLSRISATIVVIGFVVSVIHAWRIADYLA